MVSEDFKRELGHLLKGALEEAQISTNHPWTTRGSNDEKIKACRKKSSCSPYPHQICSVLSRHALYENQ